MAHTITVSISNGSPVEMLEEAQTAAQRFGFIFVGDQYCGRFTNNHKFSYGVYRVNGSRVFVTVVKKPMLAPWSVVDQHIYNFFSPAAG